MRLLSVILLASYLVACGRSKPAATDAGEEAVPKTVTNYMTEKYKDLPGTKLSLLVPNGFTYDAALGGWSSASKNSWIVASNFLGKPLMVAGIYKSRLTDKTRPDALEGTFLKEWNITMNALPSRLMKVSTSLGGDDHEQYVLFIGDTTVGYRVTGSVHEDEDTLAPKVKESLLSIFFDADRKIGGSATQTSASPCNCEKDKKQ